MSNVRMTIPSWRGQRDDSHWTRERDDHHGERKEKQEGWNVASETGAARQCIPDQRETGETQSVSLSPQLRQQVQQQEHRYQQQQPQHDGPLEKHGHFL